MFKVGDKILAKEGVCPGHYGTVTGLRANSDIVYVTYDSGRKDSIFERMIELVEANPMDFEIDNE